MCDTMADTNKNKLRLHCPILLLCERKDMAEFVGSYMRYLFKQGVTLPNLQLINLGNLDELPKFLRYVEQNEDLSTLKKIRVLADAGETVRQKQRWLETLKNASFLRGFADYEYFLFPGKQSSGYWSKGYLEDILVRCLDKKVSEKADFTNLYNVTLDFLLSINNCRGYQEHLHNNSRHMLHALLAGTERYVGMSVGEATKAGAFRLDGPEFDSLKAMLMRL